MAETFSFEKWLWSMPNKYRGVFPWIHNPHAQLHTQLSTVLHVIDIRHFNLKNVFQSA